MIRSINPANGKVLKIFTEISKKELEKKLVLSENCFNNWSQTKFSLRAELLYKVAKTLREKKDELGKIMTLEMGKTIFSSVPEVAKCADICEYFADNGEKFLLPEKIVTEANESYIEFQPLGTILAIMPWNYPFSQVFRYVAPAIMAGNTTVLKHASNVPQSAIAIEKVFLESGAPQGLFQTLLISAKTAQELIADPRIKGVTLTGSEQAGRKIAKTAGANLKKVILELGGSDPFVVLEDADIKRAVKVGAASRLLVTGQTCISAKRFILHKKIAKEFLSLFKIEMENRIIGDPMDKTTEVGPLSSLQIVKDLESQVSKSLKMGAKILTGGKKISGQGFFYPPTILTNITSTMPVYIDETFGPVASIIIVKDDNEALKVANDTRYGLGATIFTKNKKKADYFIKNIRAGNVYINSMVRSNPKLPFGGTKASGFGRELSSYGIKEFVNIKTVYIEV